MRRIYSFLLSLLLIQFVITDCRPMDTIVLPEIESGILNLENVDLVNKKVFLKGDWEFHWNEFRNEFDSSQNTLKHVHIPSHWIDLESQSGEPVKIEGIATFKASIILPESQNKLGLRIPPMDTGFVLYWNGEEIARNGNIYKETGDSFPHYYAPLVLELKNTKKGENLIHLHMANSIYPRPGFRDIITLGIYDELEFDFSQKLFIDVFLTGALFIIGLYHLGLWILRRDDASTLYFSLLTFVMVLRISVTGEAVAYQFFPIYWKLSTFIEYISFYSACAFLLLFIKSLYPHESIRNLDYITLGIILFFNIIVILFPISVYTKSLMYFQIFTITLAIYYYYIVIKAMINKRESATGFFVAMLVFLATYVNDALYANRVIESFFMIGIGIFTFFFAQAFLLSKRFANAFNTAATLTLELDAKVRERTMDLENEKERSDNLLKNILPDEIALELKERGTVKPMYYPSVTVMFIDFVDFTRISESMNPNDLVNELDTCFRAFDEIVERNGLEKLKTIGDAYMCASGLPVSNAHHAIQCCEAAMEIRSWMENYQSRRKREGKPYWGFRIGIHSGSVTAGVIGSKKFAYDIWGDTVNVASRMEAMGEPNAINVSQTTYDILKDKLKFTSRGDLDVKGKGILTMYNLEK
jgi:class 3 adenylate cyclase